MIFFFRIDCYLSLVLFCLFVMSDRIFAVGIINAIEASMKKNRAILKRSNLTAETREKYENKLAMELEYLKNAEAQLLEIDMAAKARKLANKSLNACGTDGDQEDDVESEFEEAIDYTASIKAAKSALMNVAGIIAQLLIMDRRETESKRQEKSWMNSFLTAVYVLFGVMLAAALFYTIFAQSGKAQMAGIVLAENGNYLNELKARYPHRANAVMNLDAALTSRYHSVCENRERVVDDKDRRLLVITLTSNGSELDQSFLQEAKTGARVFIENMLLKCLHRSFVSSEISRFNQNDLIKFVDSDPKKREQLPVGVSELSDDLANLSLPALNALQTLYDDISDDYRASILFLNFRNTDSATASGFVTNSVLKKSVVDFLSNLLLEKVFVSENLKPIVDAQVHRLTVHVI